MSEKELYNKIVKKTFNIDDSPQDNDIIIRIDKFMNKVVDFLETYENAMNDWSISVEERLVEYEENFKKLITVVNSNKAEAELTKAKDTIFATKSVTESNRTVNGRFMIKETRGIGIISQLLLISESDNYILDIMIDDYNVYHKPYSYFFDNSKHLNDITATIVNKKYYLTMPNLQFKKKFRIQIITKNSTLFNEIMLRYEIKDEREY